MSDALWSGRRFCTFNFIDKPNRKALAIEIDARLPARHRGIGKTSGLHKTALDASTMLAIAESRIQSGLGAGVDPFSWPVQRLGYQR